MKTPPSPDDSPSHGPRLRSASARKRLSTAASTSAVLALMILSGCTSQPDDASPAASAASSPAADVLATELDAPWSVVPVDGSLLVSERDTGRIVEVLPDGTTREAGVIADAEGATEGGLLGLARSDSGDLYAYMTTETDNRIQRFSLEGEPGSLSLGEPETILDGIPATWFHNGGRIAFGPDGMLYAGTGDAGNSRGSQDLDYLGGKILRMTPDGDVPDDNPYAGSLVYSLGHRNVQGIAWAEDGTMFASEFGQDTWDELNVIEPGSNYGWPNVEGDADDPDYVDPVQQWRPADASPSGLTVAGDTIYIANLRGGRLRAIPVDDRTSATDYYVGEYGRLRDVTPAEDGGLLLLTNNTDGRGSPGPDDDRLLHIAVPQGSANVLR
jgi:glucose/arabinose dehydrogenase